MPGGFHPFHAGHASLYQSALKAFPNADVYVAATNDTKTRPFPFSIKEKLAKLAGVQQGHFIQVKSPFKAEEITSHYNPNEDVLIFVRSEKDKTEQPKPGGTKKDGTPAYFQPWTGKNLQPFSKHAYIAYLPTVEFGPGIKSATEIRSAWPNLDDRRKTAMVMSLYPVTQKNPKLAANVVKMLDIGMGGQLNEFAPGNGDDGLPYAEYVVYQCDPQDQFEFIGKPLYQTDSLGMAHKFAYEYFLRYRPKAFVVYQPHKEASRGNYGVKGESDELEENVAEGSTGTSVRKWANQVRKDHGADVKFWNRKEGGGAVDSVIARNSQGETVGVYNRKTGYPTVFEPMQGVEESEEALQFATKAHAGQTRSGGEPYVNHPIRVADSIKQYKQSHNLDALINAALLHDTVEDTDTTHEALHDLFGGLVASLVKELTSDPEQIKKMGKAQYLAHKMAAMSSYALVIKLADRLDNVKDITTARTPEWRQKYKNETEQILNYIEKTRALSNTHKIFIDLIRNKIAELDNPQPTQVTENTDYLDEK